MARAVITEGRPLPALGRLVLQVHTDPPQGAVADLDRGAAAHLGAANLKAYHGGVPPVLVRGVRGVRGCRL